MQIPGGLYLQSRAVDTLPDRKNRTENSKQNRSIGGFVKMLITKELSEDLN
jgi:hypothetical protein